MKILLCGASGFIGSNLSIALRRAGHELQCAARHVPPNDPHWIAVDYERDHSPQNWLARLRGIDVLINAVGILRENGAATFENLHVRAPIALFEAAAQAGVHKVIQISALGADEQAQSAYHLSKKRADDFLVPLGIDWTIVQPSLVYGAGGASARLFNTLAALPIIKLPGRGMQQVQPIHIDDLCEAIVRIVDSDSAGHQRIALVGPHALTLREWLLQLRAQMKLRPAPVWPVPVNLMRVAAKIGNFFPRALLDEESFAMLERGNTASAEPITRLLGRAPRSTTAFIPPRDARASADSARLNWLLPLLRLSVALVWIVTGLLSLGLFPTDQSYAMLARVGIVGALAPWMLYGAALMDLALGFAIFLLRRRRWLWRLQIALILLYSLVISIYLPEFWLHPFGPILKNIPLLAVLLFLHEFEDR